MHFRARLLSCVLLPASPWYRGVFVFPLQTHTICIYPSFTDAYYMCSPFLYRRTLKYSFTLPLQTHTPSVFGSISAEDKCFSAPNILPTSNGRHLYNGCQSDSLAQSYHSDHGFQPTVIPRAAGRCWLWVSLACRRVDGMGWLVAWLAVQTLYKLIAHLIRDWFKG